ncbi:hypothetical protein L218DRAFT_965986 [Marasmius fiardii PR-910]|nr:hypothetical protein L218DRAFT_965986 [Marasmius fiardii PR-910]
MSPIQDQLQRVRDAVSNCEPWVSGTLQVPSDSLSLFYLDKSDVPQPQYVKLIGTTAPEGLSKLSISCDKATFGRAKEDVLDESYRKAGKMDLDRFSSKLDSHVVRLLPKILPQLLNGTDLERDVEAELYKLNVYDTGSFFRVHKDTPRSNHMFGSLVVVFPTPHTGGQLVLRHDGSELTFDSGTLLSPNASNPDNTIAYVTFFSDVEHEVLPVTSGYRITLTYNLYYSTSPPGLLEPNTTRISELKESISTLLDNPDFCPKGGLLGFPLSHQYPLDPGRSNHLNDILSILKGEDAIIRLTCQQLGLTFSINTIVHDEDAEFHYKTWGGGRLLLDRAIDLSEHGDVEMCLLEYLMDAYEPQEGEAPLRAQLIHPFDEGPCSYCRKTNEPSKAIAWIRDLKDGRAGYNLAYAVYGNERNLECEYVNVVLVVAFGPAGDRKNWMVYEGETEELEISRR